MGGGSILIDDDTISIDMVDKEYDSVFAAQHSTTF